MGRGAAAGVLVLWEEGSVPSNHWHHIRQAGALSWAVETGAPGGRGEGRGCVADAVVPLELS